MRSIMKKCGSCGSYTLEDSCKKCGGMAISVIPPRYSPQDRYGKYRMKMLYGKE